MNSAAYSSFRNRMSSDDGWDSSNFRRGGSGRRRDEERPRPLLDMPMSAQRGMSSMPMSRRSPALLDMQDFGRMGSSAASMREQRLMQIVQQQQEALNSMAPYRSSVSTGRDPLSSRISSSRSPRSAPRRSSRRESYAVTEGVDADDDRRVFVGFENNEGSAFLYKDDLLDVFEDFGPVCGVRIAPNGKYGFVSFDHVTAANDAVDSLDKTSFVKGGPVMKVERVDPNARAERRATRESRSSRGSLPLSRRLARPDGDRRSLKRPRGRDSSFGPRPKRINTRVDASDGKPTVFLGYLEKVVDQVMTEDSVRNVMEPFGAITKVVVANSQKYAFISFEEEKDGKAAIEGLHEKPFGDNGPKLRVEWVRSEPRERGGSLKGRIGTGGKPSRSKYADISLKAPKLLITKDQEKEYLALDVPLEAVYCYICDISAFSSLKSFISHVKSSKHATARFLTQTRNKAVSKMLYAASDVAEFQKESKVLSKFASRYNFSPDEDTVEKKAYKAFGHDLECKPCEKKLRNMDERNDHFCDLYHLKKAHESGITYKAATPNNIKEEKEQLLSKIQADINEAMDKAAEEPITLENQPTHKGDECFGLDRIEETSGFYCNSCRVDLTIPQVLGHCKGHPHYQCIIDELKKAKADEIREAAENEAEVNGDSKYTVVDEASEDEGHKDAEMKSPNTGDLDQDEEENENVAEEDDDVDDEEEEPEAESGDEQPESGAAAADFF